MTYIYIYIHMYIYIYDYIQLDQIFAMPIIVGFNCMSRCIYALICASACAYKHHRTLIHLIPL